MVAVAVCAENRWQGFDALTASDPNCSVSPETWTTRDADGNVLKTEQKFRLNVRWDAFEDGKQMHHTFWWSLEPNRRKAFLACADWLDEAEARIAKAQERK